jgi:hypothetical protein
LHLDDILSLALQNRRDRHDPPPCLPTKCLGPLMIPLSHPKGKG